MLDLTRTLDTIDQNKLNQYPITIVGLGAVGSNVAIQLTRMGVRSLTLIDFDIVSSVNLPLQGFDASHIGLSKTDALKLILERINPDCVPFLSFEAITPKTIELIAPEGIVISCADSMSCRSCLYRHFNRRGMRLMIDSRMGLESFRVFALTEETKRRYQETLFPDSEASPLPCTAKGTQYTASIVSGVVAGLVKRFTQEQTPLPFEVQGNCLTYEMRSID